LHVGLHLGHLGLGVRLDVELRREGVKGAGELLALLLDLRLDLLGGLVAHRRSPFTVAMSCFRPVTARSGVGEPTSETFFLPSSAAIPATANSTAVTISAAAQAGSTRASRRTNVVSRAARPKNAISPATLNI